MVKQRPLLDGIEREAGVRYHDTKLARRAPAARRRLLILLGIALGGMLVEGALHGSGWFAGAVILALAMWRLHAQTLGGLVLTALLALLAVLVPVGLYGTTRPDDAATLVPMGVALVLGLAALPDAVLLARDAELQHAFGLWARRDEA